MQYNHEHAAPAHQRLQNYLTQNLEKGAKRHQEKATCSVCNPAEPEVQVA